MFGLLFIFGLMLIFFMYVIYILWDKVDDLQSKVHEQEHLILYNKLAINEIGEEVDKHAGIG